MLYSSIVSNSQIGRVAFINSEVLTFNKLASETLVPVSILSIRSNDLKDFDYCHLYKPKLFRHTN